MSVLIVGTTQFADPLAAVCERGGHHAVSFPTDDFLAAPGVAAHDIFIDVENTSLEKKRAVLERAQNQALILTCALSASTTTAASWIPVPGRVVGFGILPPVPAQGAIELARGLRTSDAAWEHAQSFWKTVHQNVTVVADGAALVRARVVCAVINEAFSALQDQVASPREIDLAMRLGTNYPYGPFEWGEQIGLATVLGVMEGLYREWREDRYRPAPWMVKYAAAKMSPLSGK